MQETRVHSWSGKIPHAEWQLSPCTMTAEAQAAAWASALQQGRPLQGAHAQQWRPSTAKKDKILKKINCSLVEMSHLTFDLLWVWDHWGFNILCTEPELVLSSFLVRKEEKFFEFLCRRWVSGRAWFSRCFLFPFSQQSGRHSQWSCQSVLYIFFFFFGLFF